ncbi:heat shock protein 70kD, putative [Entamoeba dispar SAW760]|uniref:Heat shock protein 70kD, putative n=1 Tax=Entamoeba dispar (strain ATCC PRA-260 / SAW760) TaxID=370354 RepID=B0EMW2_ENTDS|nr:heat shock protein 70kD, putative [Entamoeba dispar SAW760]EDR24086.1 heat shock protein 70kD, putative [Entamoeba dispar SAW760]|eukprot:EDR24086.1 heat shock protein 70kD, putative [Entamoeba dispar SAW760]
MSIEKDVVYVGIDLGTTFTSVCEIRNNNPFFYTSELGYDSIRSCVAFTGTKCIVGQNENSVKNSIFEVKRLMGKRVDSEGLDLKNLKGRLLNTPVELSEGRLAIEVERPAKKGIKNQVIRLLPEQVSALILLKVKELILKIHKNVTIKAVIGVPAAFGDEERRATERAVKMAGIELIRMVNEPTAAAMAYEIKDGSVFVFDFGGGTLDISVINYVNGRPQVKVTMGDPFLGGNDIDYNIQKYLIEEIKERAKGSCSEEEINNIIEKKKGVLKNCAEDLKKGLSEKYNKSREATKVECTIDIGIKDLEDQSFELTYTKFLELNQEIFKRCQELMKRALRKSGYTQKTIDHVLMVGGSCKCPRIKGMLIDFFGSEKVDQINTDFDLLVCKGCAFLAQSIATEDISNILEGEIASKTIGIELMDVSTNKKSIEPIIKSGTPIPYETKRVFVTTVDYQKELLLKIYEDQNLLTDLLISPLPTMVAGFVEIEVTFSIADDGKLLTKAKVTKPLNISLEKQCLAMPQHQNYSELEIIENSKEIEALYYSK